MKGKTEHKKKTFERALIEFGMSVCERCAYKLAHRAFYIFGSSIASKRAEMRTFLCANVSLCVCVLCMFCPS